MSLLKARRKDVTKYPTVDMCTTEFLSIVDESLKNPKADDVYLLVKTYIDLSVLYLVNISTSLQNSPDVADTMKYMNSYIAEFMNATGMKYYHAEEGYTIIDKCLQKALDLDQPITETEVIAEIKAIQDSYFVDEEDVTVDVEEA